MEQGVRAMVVKKRTGTTNAAHTMAIVLEDIRSQFAVFGEAIVGLRESMERRFESVDARFESIDARFDRMDGRFDSRRFAVMWPI
jgi:hypothetical protein